MKVSEAMKAAIEQAESALKSGETPVGAVIVRGNEIIAWAHNQTEISHDATAHAEILAIKRASKILNDWRLSDCTLFVTLEPCAMCAGAIVNARISRVVFGAYDRQFGACVSALNLLDGSLGYKIPCVGSIMADECELLLDTHFDKVRERARVDKDSKTL